VVDLKLVENQLINILMASRDTVGAIVDDWSPGLIGTDDGSSDVLHVQLGLTSGDRHESTAGSSYGGPSVQRDQSRLHTRVETG
jgi:hypothetical protein